MGYLLYGSPAVVVEFDDRALAHLRVVIIAKLRRNESFTFDYALPPEHGSGRVSLWLHPAIGLQFVFRSGHAPDMNRAWIEVLVRGANTARGLQLLPEPEPAAAHELPDGWLPGGDPAQHVVRSKRGHTDQTLIGPLRSPR
ncbi:DUF7882 family protein [Subtercola lobariae]|uniref:DUF7882 domain-containing protein n=1 Tax=Subtercola lobariae TaxID=1588641 RepID=A0A917B4K7_9MICO|nr:hypothetical protein [Subtercola lobariae]GGF23231.1 hypothetical protein GCM10011399_16040 [Subtercola lobariae]